MKPLVLITSCEPYRHNGFNNAVRKTWLASWGDRIDYKFIIAGAHSKHLADELLVDAPDDYAGGSRKGRAAFRWAIANTNNDHIFRVDVDAYVAVPRLVAAKPTNADYVGCAVFDPPYAGGGSGYWLSRKAATVLAADMRADIPQWDDLWAGRTLLAAGIPVAHDARYWTDAFVNANGILCGGCRAFPYQDPAIWDTGTITAHLGRGTGRFDPKWLHGTHESFLKNARGGK